MKALGKSHKPIRITFWVLVELSRHCSASQIIADSVTDGLHAIVRKHIASLMSRVGWCKQHPASDRK